MKYILSVYVMFFMLISNAQSQDALDTTRFPYSWCGYWEGKLEIIGSEGVIQALPMAYDISMTDQDSTLIWALIYGEDVVKGRRDYRLKVLDQEKGLYLMDEQNSIELSTYYIDGKLLSMFEVQDNILLSSQHMVGDSMIHEIIFTNRKNPKISGNQVIENDTIPKVMSFPLKNIQRGVLYKKQ